MSNARLINDIELSTLSERSILLPLTNVLLEGYLSLHYSYVSLLLLVKYLTHFDNQLVLIPGLTWLPWVGEQYASTAILLIGESFYSDGTGWLTRSDAVRQMVNNQGLHSERHKYSKSRLFRSIERTLLAKPTSSFAEREKVWTSVGYLNLVQRVMASIKERPTEQDFDNGWRVLLEVASVLRPQVCIRLGVAGIGRLERLLATGKLGWQYTASEFRKRPLVVHLEQGEYQLKLICVNHPSGSFGYQYKKWAAVIQQAGGWVSEC